MAPHFEQEGIAKTGSIKYPGRTSTICTTYVSSLRTYRNVPISQISDESSATTLSFITPPTFRRQTIILGFSERNFSEWLTYWYGCVRRAFFTRAYTSYVYQGIYIYISICCMSIYSIAAVVCRRRPYILKYQPYRYCCSIQLISSKDSPREYLLCDHGVRQVFHSACTASVDARARPLSRTRIPDARTTFIRP